MCIIPASKFSIAGYYCIAGSATPTQFTAPPGFYTLSGAYQATPCAAGTYNQQLGQSACTACPAGFVCTNQSTIYYTICPPGFVCPTGSAVPTPCPAGTYSTAINLQNVSACTPCPPTMYCATAGLTVVTGACSGACVYSIFLWFRIFLVDTLFLRSST